MYLLGQTISNRTEFMGVMDLERSSLTLTVLIADRFTENLSIFLVFLISLFLDSDDVDKNDGRENRWNFSLY